MLFLLLLTVNWIIIVVHTYILRIEDVSKRFLIRLEMATCEQRWNQASSIQHTKYGYLKTMLNHPLYCYGVQWELNRMRQEWTLTLRLPRASVSELTTQTEHLFQLIYSPLINSEPSGINCQSAKTSQRAYQSTAWKSAKDELAFFRLGENFLRLFTRARIIFTRQENQIWVVC